jgi:adenine-specific DNA-methyltransferase
MIKLLEKKLAQFLKPAYKSKVIATDQIKKFTDALLKQKRLFDEKESEENQKKLMVDFLEDAFYTNYYINTQARKDTVIHHGKDGKSKVGVIIETKRAKSSEMISDEKPNVKALHELIWYYFLERQTNNEVCHLIATDFHTWYIFDENEFDRNFYHQTEFKNLYKNSFKHTNSSEWFYEEVKKLLANTETSLTYTCLSMNELINGKGLIKISKTQLANIYKILSPEHLLKLSFNNDSNQLNQGFYKELLHIIGLEEAKDDTSNKKIIRRIRDLSQRNEGSLLENTLSELKLSNCLHKVSNLDSFGQDEEEQLFSIALELCITWLNRILFLKLLESQIVAHSKGNEDKRFLTAKKIYDYDILYELFFRVLAVSPESRKQTTHDYFGEIPYLNSSLFEKTQLEEETLSINEILNRLSIPYFSQSVLKDSNGKRSLSGEATTLSYLLDFLNAYNFGSDDTGDIIQDRPKDLISASVLGLIFEKLNGYKDGSFFTPSFITMYMCRKSIRRAVVQKFNDNSSFIPEEGFENFEDLADQIDYHKLHVRQEANQLINSLHICDPAVGSGHFLVSALNELIQIKYDLKILSFKHNQARIDRDWKIEIDNDELRITHSDSLDSFVYNPQNEAHHALQETLFHEKQTLIENCLFGVDINPKSVSICRLRLWIELLKNAYYKPTTNQLQVLPNIDINIKIGNSLVSRFGMNSIESFTKSTETRQVIKEIVRKYAEQVLLYKNNTDSRLKPAIKKEINLLKESFSEFVVTTDKDYLKMKSKEAERTLIRQNFQYIDSLQIQISLDTPEQQKTNLIKKTRKIESEYEELKRIWQHKLDTLYKYAFEWRFEFPEVLDDRGNFIGFDIIVGNPPYFSLSKEQSLKQISQKYATYESSGDIYALFYELGNTVLKQDGILHYITGSAWLKASYGQSLRQFLVEEVNPISLIDFSDCHVFDEATVLTTVMEFTKNPNENSLKAIRLAKKQQEELKNITTFFNNNFLYLKDLTSNAWVITDASHQKIRQKIDAKGVQIKDWDFALNNGIKTGCDSAFHIDEATRNLLIAQDPKSAEIIVPMFRGRDIDCYSTIFKNNYLINTHNGENITLKNLEKDILEENGQISVKIGENWQSVKRLEYGRNKEVRINRVVAEIDYPAIYEHLKTFEETLKSRSDKGKHWSNLRSCAYLSEFEKPKIIYPNMTKFMPFTYDESGCYANQKCYVLTGNNLKFLLAFFNSKLFKYCFTTDFPELQGNTREINKVVFEQLSVIQPTLEQSEPIIKKVDLLLIQKGNLEDTTQLEVELDEMIMDLYDLSQEERFEVHSIR